MKKCVNGEIYNMTPEEEKQISREKIETIDDKIAELQAVVLENIGG